MIWLYFCVENRGREAKEMNKIRSSYEHTIYASYIGYITQAIVNNFAPLLFLTFKDTYRISLEMIALIPSIFYLTQLLVDFAATVFPIIMVLGLFFLIRKAELKDKR